MLRIAEAIGATGIADHVVVEHGLDDHPLLLDPVGKALRAVEPLLLAREQRVDDRRGVFLPRQDTRGFEDHHAARAIVVGTGRIARAVERIGDAAVVVRLHDHDLVGALAAALDGNRVADQCGRGDTPTVGLDHAPDRLHVETAIAGRSDAAELIQRPVHSRADAALGIGLAGKRVPRSERDDHVHVRAQPLLGNLRGQGVVRALRQYGRSEAGGGQAGEASKRARHRSSPLRVCR